MVTDVIRQAHGLGLTEGLTRLFNLRRDDVGPASRLVALRFCTGFTFIVAETVAMTLFLSRFDGTLFGFDGIAALPVVYILGAVATVVLGAAQLYLQKHFPVGRVIIANMVFVTALLAGFYAAMAATGSVYLYPALFVVIEIIWVLFALNAELTANCIFNVRQAKRVMALVNGGEPISFMVGAFTVAGLVSFMGVTNVLLVAILFMLVALGIYVGILREAGSALTGLARRDRSQRSATPILRMRFVWLLAAFVILLQFAIYITYTQSRAAISLTFEEMDIAICLGILEGSMGAARVVLSFLVVNRVIARIGLFPVASLLPVAVVATGVLVVFSPLEYVFVFIIATYVVDRVLRFSFGSATTPLMYHCLPEQRKAQVQSFISGVIAPVGAGLSGLLLLGFSDTISGGFADLAVIAWGLIAIGIVALPVLLLLRREYLSSLLRLAEGKRLNVEQEDFVDPGAIAILRERLATEDPVEVVFVVGNLQKVDPEGLVEAMPTLLDHPAEIVRVRALEALVALSAKHDLGALTGQIGITPRPDDGVDTRIAKIRALAAILGNRSVEFLETAANDNDARVHAAALAALAKWGGGQGLAHVKPKIVELTASPRAADRVQALEVVRDSEEAELWPSVEILLRDPDPLVRMRALEIVGRLRLERFYPVLLAALDDSATSATASWLLSGLGPEVLPTLRKGLSTSVDSPSLRPALLRLAGRIDHPDAQSLLVEAISSTDPRDRQLALEQLFHTRTLRLDLAEDDQFDLLRQERAFYLELARLAVVVDRFRAEPQAGLLADALSDALEDTLLRVLFQLRLSYPRDILRSVHTTWTRPASRHVALEILDNVLRQPIRDAVLSLFDQTSRSEKVRNLARAVETDPAAQTPQELAGVIAVLCGPGAKDYGQWISICALHATSGLDPETRRNLSRPYLEAPNPLLREVAGRASASAAPAQPAEETGTMLSTMEKLLFLKKVTIFDQVRDEYLAALASGLEEVTFEKNEVIFKENDVGDSMYIIVSGTVRLEKGGAPFRDPRRGRMRRRDGGARRRTSLGHGGGRR